MGNREHITTRYRVAVSVYSNTRFYYLLKVIFDYIERNKLNWKVSHENRRECQLIWVETDNILDIDNIRSLLV